MAEQFFSFDPAEDLDSREAIEIFMADAFATGNAQHIAEALSIVARAIEMMKTKDAAKREGRE